MYVGILIVFSRRVVKLIGFLGTQKGGSLSWILSFDPYVAVRLSKSRIGRFYL